MRAQENILSIPHRTSKNKLTSIPKLIGNRSSSVSHNISSIKNKTQPQSSQNLIKQNPNFTFYLGKGNNQILVKSVLQSRGCWKQSLDSTSTFVNFKWQQDQKGFRYNRMVDKGMYKACLNQFQFHQCLSNKQFLFRNLQAYCQKTGDDIWRIVPPTFILNVKDQNSMLSLKQFIQFYVKNYPQSQKQAHPDYQKIAYEQRRKLKLLFFNSNEKKKINLKMPKMNRCFLSDSQGDYLWILKPTFLNRGRGIQIFSELNTLNKIITENLAGYIERGYGSMKQELQKNNTDYIKKNSEMIKLIGKIDQQENKQKKKVYLETKESTFDGNKYIRIIPKVPTLIKTDCFLIQKYLQKPLLIKNHKFDIRMWVLVTHNLSVYLFKQGYIRLSSSQYNCKYNEDNATVHLTNNAVQKFTSQYGKISEGNQMSFANLKQVMYQNGLSFDKCYKTIQKHVEKSMAATIPKLNALNRRYTFEIFGYDFMIDYQGYPWLIEVNNNPCIQESSTLLSKLLPRMLDDAFKLTIDVIFFGSRGSKKYPVYGYADNENMWKSISIPTSN